MYVAKKTPEEQYQLVLECRRSGLTDCDWCRKNGINPNRRNILRSNLCVIKRLLCVKHFWNTNAL